MLKKVKMSYQMRSHNTSNIVTLIGMMGTGKSKFGSLIAKKNNLHFYDSDHLIEKRFDLSVKDLFKIHGELFFRKVEQEEILYIIKKSEMISSKVFVSIGGGAYDDERTRNLLLEKSKVIWLNTPIEKIIDRIHDKSKRPMIKGDIKDSLEELLKKRLKYYRQCHYRIDTEKLSQKNIEEIISYISLS